MSVTEERDDPQLVHSGLVIDGVCEGCDTKGPVGVVYRGDDAETLAFYCRPCGQDRGVLPPPNDADTHTLEEVAGERH